VLRGLSKVEWSLLISVLRDVDRVSACQRMLKLPAKVDGMLIVEGIIDSDQFALLAARLPVVLIAGSPDQPHDDVIAADNRAGTEALVGHLIEQHGRTRLYNRG
jgi:DNA-binding LacI/PurR family transcriptional regulator